MLLSAYRFEREAEPPIRFVAFNPGASLKDKGCCVFRAIATASGLPYEQVVENMAAGARRERPRGGRGRSSPSNGVYTSAAWFKEYMRSLGFTWTPTMGIGTGCRVHLKADELPMGRLVVMVSRHACAVVDRVLYDYEDCSRGGTRCVYGFWKLQAQPVLKSTGTRERHLL